MVILLDCLQALESLNKKDMTEIKTYGRPPALVETVMQAVMILRGCEPTWAEAKRQLGTRKREMQIIIKSLNHTDVTHGFRRWLRHEIHTRLLYNQNHMSQTERERLRRGKGLGDSLACQDIFKKVSIMQ